MKNPIRYPGRALLAVSILLLSLAPLSAAAKVTTPEEYTEQVRAHFAAEEWEEGKRLLDEALCDLAGATGAGYCPISLDLLPGYLAIDGFHPSQLGYQVWTGALADWLAAREKGGVAVV